MPEVDLTSGHFLGDLGPAPALRSLTSGRPAVLEEPARERELGRTVARLLGREDGLLARSSFHALLDALATGHPTGGSVLVDEAVYPVARWAVAAAADLRGMDVQTYRHLSAADASRRARSLGRSLVVVTDGLCGSCLRPAPLGRLDDITREVGGRLVVDDSLAMGVLGPRGAGTTADLGSSSTVTVVASGSKAWAAPVAVLAGPWAVVEAVRQSGPARTHASPPSNADTAALRRALDDPLAVRRRARLARLVGLTRRAATRSGLPPVGVAFPVVSLPERGTPAPTLRQRMLRHGVRTLVTVGGCRDVRALTMCLRADLDEAELAHVLRALHQGAEEAA